MLEFLILPKYHVKLHGGFEFSEMHSIGVDELVVSRMDVLSSLLFGTIFTYVGLTGGKQKRGTFFILIWNQNLEWNINLKQSEKPNRF